VAGVCARVCVCMYVGVGERVALLTAAHNCHEPDLSRIEQTPLTNQKGVKRNGTKVRITQLCGQKLVCFVA
jgi:hypothetical protein